MMLKKVLPASVCMAAIVMLLICGTATAGSRFESGFRGIAWATPKSRLPDLGLSEKSLKKIYKSGPASVFFMEGRGKLALNMDGIPLLSIFMHFEDQIFCGVDLIFKPENRERIYSTIANEMESPGKPGVEGVRWKTENLIILLTDRELMVSYRRQ